jgi:hypothetical protein
MERLCKFVSSRGILKSCDHHNKDPQSSSSHIDADLLTDLKAGDSIYVCYEALPNFVDNFLSRIFVYFTLVTGDSDHDVTMYKRETDMILNHPHLMNWYVQNRAIEHPKLQALPIGLDFHTVWEKQGTWGLRKISPMAQERLLLQNLYDALNMDKKILAYYCNWMTNGAYGDRQECYDKIDKEACFFENLPRARKYMLQRQAEFFITVSPRGVSYECHRTYETLVLGGIPIIKRNPLVDCLYDDLPVIKVDDWSEVKGHNAEMFVKQMLSQEYDFNSLFLQHWANKIKGKKYNPLPKMNMADFKELLTANYF